MLIEYIAKPILKSIGKSQTLEMMFLLCLVYNTDIYIGINDDFSKKKIC